MTIQKFSAVLQVPIQSSKDNYIIEITPEFNTKLDLVAYLINNQDAIINWCMHLCTMHNVNIQFTDMLICVKQDNSIDFSLN